MKFFQISLLVLSFFLVCQTSQAQTEALPKVMTDTLEVKGVCNMCKARIEEAAMYVRGVKFAEWDKTTQLLNVVYSTKRTDGEQICQAVAEAGHDTESLSASDKAYQKLPDCCKYRSGIKGH